MTNRRKMHRKKNDQNSSFQIFHRCNFFISNKYTHSELPRKTKKGLESLNLLTYRR